MGHFFGIGLLRCLRTQELNLDGSFVEEDDKDFFTSSSELLVTLPRPTAASSSRQRMCRMFCGRSVQPGLTRTLKSYDTCCKKCAQTEGSGAHDDNCGATLKSTEAAPGEDTAGAHLKEQIARMLQDPRNIRQHMDHVLAGVLGGGSNSLNKHQVAQGIYGFIASFDSNAGQRCAREPVLSEMIRKFGKRTKHQLSRDEFYEMSRFVLDGLWLDWFPEKLPLSTSTFVRQNCRPFEEVYRLEGKIGQGSFGVVHSVEHLISGETRVCKQIRKNKDDADTSMILNEIHSMAMLDHPNVIKVYEYFNDASSVMQIMEPCYGGDLKIRIERSHKKRDEPYGEAFMYDVMKQTMRALAFMHSRRFAHKDLKPENIMMVEQGSSSIKIIDFGFAELFNPHSDCAMFLGGTLLFMPPEVFVHSQMTMRSDVWSAGVVLYNLVTGTYPFMGQWPPPQGCDASWWEQNTRERIVQEQMAPHRLLEEASEQCRHLLLQMLEKDQGKRPDASQCLEHDWFQMRDEVPPLSVGVTQNVEAYTRMSELKKAIFLLMAHQSARPGAVQELRAIFTHFDTRNSGSLTAHDLRRVLANCKMPPLSAERVVHALDRDDTGAISWTEFLSAALCVSICRNEKLVDAAFSTFDRDCDGKIGIDDLEFVLGGHGEFVAGWRAKLPKLFLEMVPPEHRPDEGAASVKQPLWVHREQFRHYMGMRIGLRMAGDRLFAVS